MTEDLGGIDGSRAVPRDVATECRKENQQRGRGDERQGIAGRHGNELGTQNAIDADRGRQNLR